DPRPGMTTRGFAFAITEGSRRLVSWGLRRIPIQGGRAVTAVEDVIRDARPLFVAFDKLTSTAKRKRGRLFGGVVNTACDIHRIMILDVDPKAVARLTGNKRATKWNVAEAIVQLFPDAASRIPPRRRPWQSEDDRIGMFMALAAAITAWENFRKTSG